MYDPDRTFRFHVELTDKCNARCPQCSRNVISPEGNLEERANLFQSELSIEDYKKIFDDFDGDITGWSLCGNYGDPVYAQDIFEITEYCIEKLRSVKNYSHEKRLHIHTNGGFRSAKWWSEFGKMFAKHKEEDDQLLLRVVFALDGLEDTHHLYRVNTRYDRVVENARAFMDAGGEAEWAYIKFGHNEHQIEEARSRSYEYGFKSFTVINTHRFAGNDSLKYIFKGKEYEITRATDAYSDTNKAKAAQYENIKELTEKSKEHIYCHTQNLNEPYIDCMGNVYPCCWIGSWDYRNQIWYQDNTHAMFDFIDREEHSALKNPIQEILANDWFQYVLPSSWDMAPCDICIRQCGKQEVKMVNIKERDDR